jgi:hypothetical protein
MIVAIVMSVIKITTVSITMAAVAIWAVRMTIQTETSITGTSFAVMSVLDWVCVFIRETIHRVDFVKRML